MSAATILTSPSLASSLLILLLLDFVLIARVADAEMYQNARDSYFDRSHFYQPQQQLTSPTPDTGVMDAKRYDDDSDPTDVQVHKVSTRIKQGTTKSQAVMEPLKALGSQEQGSGLTDGSMWRTFALYNNPSADGSLAPTPPPTSFLQVAHVSRGRLTQEGSINSKDHLTKTHHQDHSFDPPADPETHMRAVQQQQDVQHHERSFFDEDSSARSPDPQSLIDWFFEQAPRDSESQRQQALLRPPMVPTAGPMRRTAPSPPADDTIAPRARPTRQMTIERDTMPDPYTDKMRNFQGQKSRPDWETKSLSQDDESVNEIPYSVPQSPLNPTSRRWEREQTSSQSLNIDHSIESAEDQESDNGSGDDAGSVESDGSDDGSLSEPSPKNSPKRIGESERRIEVSEGSSGSSLLHSHSRHAHPLMPPPEWVRRLVLRQQLLDQQRQRLRQK